MCLAGHILGRVVTAGAHGRWLVWHRVWGGLDGCAVCGGVPVPAAEERDRGKEKQGAHEEGVHESGPVCPPIPVRPPEDGGYQ